MPCSHKARETLTEFGHDYPTSMLWCPACGALKNGPEWRIPTLSQSKPGDERRDEQSEPEQLVWPGDGSDNR